VEDLRWYILYSEEYIDAGIVTSIYPSPAIQLIGSEIAECVACVCVCASHLYAACAVLNLLRMSSLTSIVRNSMPRISF